jgi:hypothetical protein
MNTSEASKHLRIAAAFAVLFHTLGLAVAFFGIRFGTPVFSDGQRMAHVKGALWGWQVAWGVWMIAAATFVWFLAAVEKHWNAAGTCARLAMIVGVTAASLDCLFDVLQIAVLPAVAARGPEAKQTFLALAHLASAGGIILANGLYAVAVVLMTCAIGDNVSARSRALGWIVLATGLALSVVGFFTDPHLPEYFTGPAIGSYILWVVTVAWDGHSSESSLQAEPVQPSG